MAGLVRDIVVTSRQTSRIASARIILDLLILAIVVIASAGVYLDWRVLKVLDSTPNARRSELVARLARKDESNPSLRTAIAQLQDTLQERASFTSAVRSYANAQLAQDIGLLILAGVLIVVRQQIRRSSGAHNAADLPH